MRIINMYKVYYNTSWYHVSVLILKHQPQNRRETKNERTQLLLTFRQDFEKKLP